MISKNLKKGSKVKGEISLASRRGVPIEGIVKDKRMMFGRQEVLIEITKMDDVWVQERSISPKNGKEKKSKQN